MANNKLEPHRSINYIAVCNFQKFFDRSFVGAFELIFILKLDWTVKCNVLTLKDHHSIKYFFTISLTASMHILQASE